jgi:hypothetical protein
MDGREIDRGERGCESGVERYSEGECKRGEVRGRESERENKIEGERETERDKEQNGTESKRERGED